MKLEIVHADTCLPDYWGGHHLAHVQIPAFHKMTLDEIKSELRSEINQGAIAGHNEVAQLLSDNPPGHVTQAAPEEAYEAALQAIEDIEPINPEQTTFFHDVEQPQDDDNEHMVYAYFVIREVAQ